MSFRLFFLGVFPRIVLPKKGAGKVVQRKRQRLATIVGANITSHRRRMGWNQAEFAERLGIGADSLSRIERGLTAPRFPRLEKMAELLECSVADLFQTQADREKAYAVNGFPAGPHFDLCTKREVILMAEKIIQLMRD